MKKSASWKHGQPKSSAQIMLQLEMGRLVRADRAVREGGRAVFNSSPRPSTRRKDYGLTAGLLKTIAGDKGEVHELMAAAFLESGQTDEAAKSFPRLEKFNANKAVAAYNQARVAAKPGRHDEALAKLQEYFDARESSRRRGAL